MKNVAEFKEKKRISVVILVSPSAMEETVLRSTASNGRFSEIEMHNCMLSSNSFFSRVLRDRNVTEAKRSLMVRICETELEGEDVLGAVVGICVVGDVEIKMLGLSVGREVGVEEGFRVVVGESVEPNVGEEDGEHVAVGTLDGAFVGSPEGDCVIVGALVCVGAIVGHDDELGEEDGDTEGL
mmetsp:Transcript_25063/g.34978  ORF Transcript_25063/g.34978 Transcript_25063/m.34978 type:complete len:183 (+) Transcript_25063:562-1110(+)